MKKVKCVTERLFHRGRPAQPPTDEPPAGKLPMGNSESFKHVSKEYCIRVKVPNINIFCLLV
ncbi:hypothetical protein BGZ60DRAFT_423973 [Tricladium varicosporioides]|nr:hypothetical protein BGZ60DRAFT_423973 [Hymenoscyphus varicosporioides]